MYPHPDKIALSLFILVLFKAPTFKPALIVSSRSSSIPALDTCCRQRVIRLASIGKSCSKYSLPQKYCQYGFSNHCDTTSSSLKLYVCFGSGVLPLGVLVCQTYLYHQSIVDQRYYQTHATLFSLLKCIKGGSILLSL